MPSLADLPELIGFFSYSRDDDEDSEHALTRLRTRIQNELRGQLGRSRENLRLWQDQESIAPGSLWESQIDAAVRQSVFFIPIITPRVVFSRYCSVELQKFLDRERNLKRSDLVFPILYIDVTELSDERVWRDHPVLKTIGARQYVDWRDFRYDPDSVMVRRAVATFCSQVVLSLRRATPADVAAIETRPTPILLERHDTRISPPSQGAGRQDSADTELATSDVAPARHIPLGADGAAKGVPDNGEEGPKHAEDRPPPGQDVRRGTDTPGLGPRPTTFIPRSLVWATALVFGIASCISVFAILSRLPSNPDPYFYLIVNIGCFVVGCLMLCRSFFIRSFVLLFTITIVEKVYILASALAAAERIFESGALSPLFFVSLTVTVSSLIVSVATIVYLTRPHAQSRRIENQIDPKA